jgi:leader peptidase (prepilin peptidase) / N-methyltransferase
MVAAAFSGAAAAVLTGVAAGVLWLLVLPRLREPATEEEKRPYADLVTARLALMVAACAAVGAGLAWLQLPVAQRPVWVVLSTAGVVLAAVDGLTTWIPAAATRWAWLVMAAAAPLMVWLGASWADVNRTVAGGLVAGGLYGLAWLLTRGGFGFGDVRFVPLIGAAAAAVSWTLLFAALLVGSLLAVGHGVWRQVRRTGGVQPWAPSLLFGAYAALLILA